MSTALTGMDTLISNQLEKLDNKFTNLNLNQTNSRLFPVDFKSSVSSASSWTKHTVKQDDQNARQIAIKEIGGNSINISLQAPNNYVNDRADTVSSVKTNVDNSTLSLHIAAYENSLKLDKSGDMFTDKVMKEIKTINIEPLIKSNVFEFPRQQNDHATAPEVTQFNATQKLLDPNGTQPLKVYVNCKVLKNIFQKPMGDKRCQWRKQILEAAGYSCYLPSKKILWNLIRIEKETATKCKRFPAATHESVYVDIGDAREWAEEFKTENLQNTDDAVAVETADEKIKRLEEKLENVQVEKAKTDEEFLKLQDTVKQKEVRIDELELRYNVEQKRNFEKLAKLDTFEAQAAIVSEEMMQKDKQLCELMGNLKIKDKEIIKLAETNVTVAKEKDEQICKLMTEIKLKDETINQLTETNTSLNNKLGKIRALNQSKNKKLNSKGVKVLSTSRKRVKETDAPTAKKKQKYSVMENAKDYSFAFMILCVQLSWLGIFDTKIPEAIRLFSVFFNIAMPRIPNRTTIGRWCNDFMLLIEFQLDKFFEDASNLTLHSDETTLSGDKLQGYVICKIENGIRKYFVVGIEHVPDKSAARSLKALIACLKRTIKPLECLNDDTVEEILTERLGMIKNCVSDRASTQKKFNFDLWKLIASLIPGSPALNQIFCHHHIMASSWEVFIKSCFAYEKLIFDNDSLKFSTFQTAIQFISSNYGERANAPAKAKEFMDWAAKKGYKIAKFSSKLGARWNIGFSISSQLYFNRKILLEFLKETNYIIEDSHSALVKVLEWPAFIVLMQIGSWIDQVINGPWWSSMDSDMHIIEQNISSAKMINYLQQVAANPILFKDDSIFPLITERSAQQISFRNAVLANVTDAFIDIMPQFCKDLADYLNKQLNALLEDAAINDEDNREILASASVSNKVSEQIFGMTTDKRHLSSSLSIGRIAASVAGTKNRTMEYIKSLSSTEFEELRKKFKAAKVSHRQKRMEDKRNLDKEIAEHYDKTQEKQRKKKQKGEVEFNYDKYIGQNFVEKWGETEVEYEGVVTKKMGDGYEVYYPGYQQYDLYTEDELVDLIATKKIIFDK